MLPELRMVFVIVSLHCCLFDRPVPLPGSGLRANRERDALDLPVGPKMLYFGEPVLNAMFAAGAIKNMLKGKSVAFLIGELIAIIGEDDVDSIGNSGDQIAEELFG